MNAGTTTQYHTAFAVPWRRCAEPCERQSAGTARRAAGGVRKNLRKVDEERIRHAFRFCYEAHKNNERESGGPYYTHPVNVALIVATEMPLDDVSVVAALLHDVVEDTDFTIEDIRADFGDEVAEIVEGATKFPASSSPAKSPLRSITANCCSP